MAHKKRVRRRRRNPPMAIGLHMRKARKAGTKHKRTSAKRKAARKAAATRAHKHALRVKAAKKAARTRKRLGHVSTPKRHRKVHKVKTHRRRHVAKAMAPKRHRRRRRLLYKTVTKKRPTVRSKRRTLKIHGKRRRRYVTKVFSAKRNPMSAFKGMLVDSLAIYGGFKAVKLINGLLEQYVVSKIPGLPVQIAPIVPAALGFGLAAFAGKVIKKPKLLAAVQTGAGLALLDALVQKLLLPQVGASLPAVVRNALSGIDDIGYGEYVRQQPGQLSEYIKQGPGPLGAYVNEAMALDEYVQDGMHGFDVQEALADSEVQGMQSGYAAGTLAKSVFSV